MIEPGDRIVVIGSPHGRTRVGHAPRSRRAGASRTSSSSAAGRSERRSPALLTTQGIGVRVIEPNRDRAREVAEELPECRVYNTTRDRRRLPRARAHRSRAGRRLRDEGGREEPLRGDARARPRRAVHDRRRPRHDLDQGLRALGRRRDDQPARRDRGGDRPVRARSAHAAGRDARGRPLRGARHHDASRRASTSGSASATCRSAAR